MTGRLRNWARTCSRLVLLVLGYFWVGAAYKLVYAQTHDVSRFKLKLRQLPYYQQQFLIDSLLHQTWMFGPDFQAYLGRLPRLAALMSSNPMATLSDYCRQRERDLGDLPAKYPHSPFRDEALDAAYTFSQGAAFLGIFGAREQPGRAIAVREGEGWSGTGLPDFTRAAALSRRLSDEYPDSPYAPAALLRVAETEMDQGRVEEGRALFQRIALEYPRSEQAEAAANALYAAARAGNRLDAMREYRRRALRAAERAARERFPGRILPAETAVAILGYRVDLSGIELQLQRLIPAREYLAVASREAGRLESLPRLPDALREDLEDTAERMDRVRSGFWVAGLFDALGVPALGAAPRPREHPVSGRVLLNGRPLAGVDVALTERSVNPRALPSLLGLLGELPYRATTTRRGDFRIPSVPAGEYRTVLLYPTRPPEAAGAAVVPVGTPSFPVRARVEAGPLMLPPIRFETALGTRSFGELSAAGGGIPLEWDAWPNAAGYRVEVLAPPELTGAFIRRVSRRERRAFREHPVLWKQDRVVGTRTECPLEALHPDNAALAQFVQYEYRVTAQDRAGRVLARSARPLSRFHLSPAARAALLRSRRPPPAASAGSGVAPPRGRLGEQR